MGERIMKNFPIEYEGNTYWRSRSVAVVGFIFCKNEDGEWCVLANKRGPGCPNEIGKWCVPCGYLGFIEECGDIDGEHAISRETREETGVLIKPERFTFDTVKFSINNDQNVNLRYYTILDGTCDDYPLSNKDNEKDETTDIRWIAINDVFKYEWAFGHEVAIPVTYAKYIK